MRQVPATLLISFHETRPKNPIVLRPASMLPPIPSLRCRKKLPTTFSPQGLPLSRGRIARAIALPVRRTRQSAAATIWVGKTTRRSAFMIDSRTETRSVPER